MQNIGLAGWRHTFLAGATIMLLTGTISILSSCSTSSTSQDSPELDAETVVDYPNVPVPPGSKGIFKSVIAQEWLEAGLERDSDDYEGQIADYSQAIAIDPDLDIAHNNLGNSYAGLGKYEKAITSFDQAIELNSSDAAYYFNRGKTYKQLNKYSEGNP